VTAAVPADVVTALGRLNSHARDTSAFGTERKAIYDYKSLASLLLIQAEQVKLRFVQWAGKCISCNGTGWFCWYDSEQRSKCRSCSGTGTKKLQFTETTLPDGQTWHHPWNGYSSTGWDLARAALPDLRSGDGGEYQSNGLALPWEDPGDWSPRLPAVKLPIAELVPLLNAVEAWVETLPRPERGTPHWWIFHSAQDCLFQRQYRFNGVPNEPHHDYRLDLGRVSGGCTVCGSVEDPPRHWGLMTPLFHWSEPACREHGIPRASRADLPPDELLTPPVVEWLSRHGRVVETRW
jgi:hypothetical protein